MNLKKALLVAIIGIVFVPVIASAQQPTQRHPRKPAKTSRLTRLVYRS